MAGIFINYRRDDAPGVAGRLGDRLAHKFSRDEIFMDVDAIKPGFDFAKQLDEQVSKCDVVLAVIGPDWINAADDKGRHRLSQTGDYVRIELAAALKRDIPVIPLLVHGAVMPSEEELPEELKPLCRRHAMELRHTRFTADSEAIVRALNSILPRRPRWRQMAAAALAVALVLGGLGLVWTQSEFSLPGLFRSASTKTDVDSRATGPSFAPSPNVPSAPKKSSASGATGPASERPVVTSDLKTPDAPVPPPPSPDKSTISSNAISDSKIPDVVAAPTTSNKVLPATKTATLSNIGSSSPSNRVALVIGNAKYPDADQPLPEPVNDARALADQLRRNGFDVDVGENLTGDFMRRALDHLYSKLRVGSAALVFFSGFGIQSNRQSYMIPVDAQIWSESDARSQGFSLEAVLSEINAHGAGVKIALLDASRRNPFERRFRTFSAGLAPVIAPNGTLVMYSAALSSVVGDYKGDHGLFVQELLKQISVPGLYAEEALNRTRVGVTRASTGEQVPWISSSLAEDFAFAQVSSASGKK